VDELVTSGQFSNADEVVRAGLRSLEGQSGEDKEKLKLLRSLASEGFGQLDQGHGIVMEDEDELAEFVGHIGRRAAEKHKFTS
jgi:antitoxin ParD1/3/4